MKYWSTQYYLDNRLFSEEVAASNKEEATIKMEQRGLGESIDETSQPSNKPRTASVMKLFDDKKWAEAAHSACQLIRLQNSGDEALNACSDVGLIHMLLHLHVMPDEPLITQWLPQIRQQLSDLEQRVRHIM